MPEEIYVRDGALWRNCSAGVGEIHVRHSGVWRHPVEAFVRDGSVWRRFYARGILSLSSGSNIARNTDIAPYTGTAGFDWLNSGGLYRTQKTGSGLINTATDWVTGAFTASDYEFQWQAIQNTCNQVSVAESTTIWTNLGTTQYIRHAGSGGSGDTIRTFSVSIREVANPSNIVTQDYQIEAGGLN